jgi:hypothetical protein
VDNLIATFDKKRANAQPEEGKCESAHKNTRFLRVLGQRRAGEQQNLNIEISFVLSTVLLNLCGERGFYVGDLEFTCHGLTIQQQSALWMEKF